MSDFPEPVVVVSKCLEFDPCRYNGQVISDDFVRRLKPYVKLIPVCAECEIGLGVPRSPVRIILRDGEERLVQPETEHDCTEEMQASAGSFLASLGDVDGFILKGRSPSCGTKDVKVHPSTEKSAPAGKTVGFFARAVQDRFPDGLVEDEGRLKNMDIREHFLTRLFASARLRQVRDFGEMGRLVQFHADHKLVLMANNQEMMRAMGRLVANHEKRPSDDVMADYERHFHGAMARVAKRGANINVLMHGFGYFSHELGPEEKAFFLDSLEHYRKGQVPLNVPVYLLRSFAVRWHQPYLLEQTFFSRYPEELRLPMDSGKGRPGSLD